MAIFNNPTCHLLLQNTTTSTEVFYRVMERIHALMNVFPYNYSHDLLKDFVLNINSSRAFHMYPSFFYESNHKSFGLSWCSNLVPRAQVVLQENTRSRKLIPVDEHTRVPTGLWVVIALVYRVE
ncbi:hypothetical protein Hanom_Chr05g00429691 [Helianthus anomalus]